MAIDGDDSSRGRKNLSGVVPTAQGRKGKEDNAVLGIHVTYPTDVPVVTAAVGRALNVSKDVPVDVDGRGERH